MPLGSLDGAVSFSGSYSVSGIVKSSAAFQFDLQPRFAPAQQATPQGRLTGPVRLIRSVADRWGLTLEELAGLLDYAGHSMAENLLMGRLTLQGVDREDRARLLYVIHETLADLFIDPRDEEAWIRGQHPLLGNSTPLAYMINHRIPGMLVVRELVERRLANR
jgi:hypothetical protein